MKLVDPKTGHAYLEKRRRRYAEPGQPRELTFACYRRFCFLEGERIREWFRDSLQAARTQFGFQIWANVLMPEHLHLLVYPGDHPEHVSKFLQRLKAPVARQAMGFLRA